MSIVDYFDELVEDTYWLEVNEEYKQDKGFRRTFESPSRYPVFEWRELFIFHSLSLWFELTIRKHSKDRMASNGNYSVTICAVDSNVPIPYCKWNDPMKMNWEYGCFAECCYIGYKYKHNFEYDDGDEPLDGEYRGHLSKKFSNYEEALCFLKRWMKKLIDDHQEIFDKEKEMLQLINAMK